MSGNSSARVIVESATVKARANLAEDARLCLFDDKPDALADTLRADLAGLKFSIEYRSPEELMLTLHGRRFIGEAEAFAAAEAFVQAYELDAAEPEIFFTAMPVDQTDNLEGVGDLLGCWVDEEPALAKHWAIDSMRIPQAWAFADARGRPSRGAGIVVAQPDTGITKHAELKGVTTVSPRNLLNGRPNDPTDPLPKTGNPGHGTSTSSVVVSPESLEISGSAPLAKHMPIRAIESVVRLSQIKVAQAIDHAVNNGAHVITMSLGGIASLSLWLALSRAVDSGVIVLAAAGNCVGLVVWPARYDKCIGVAGVDSKDAQWQGTSRGPEIDFSAPAQNVYRATAPDKGVAQGQGTSYAVALAAGVAACWLAFHGRANVVSAARQRGETVQDMFRRMVAATARVPAGWDSFNMGAGIIDAETLLKADFDRGLGTESPTDPVQNETPANSVKSLALAKAGEKALDAEIDWQRHSAEISLSLLRSGALPEPPKELPVAKPAAEAVGGAVFEAGGVTLESMGGKTAAPSPSIGRSRTDMPAFRKFARQKEIIARRAAAEAGGSLESVGGGDPDEPLSKDAATATMDRVTELAKKMPAREMGDKGAFVAALNMLTAHGGEALQKLVGDDLSASVTQNDRVVLEAIMIADGSRPSFLIENDAPPLSHPFMGSWSDEVASAADRLKPICAAVGRIQPRFGHAGNFIGTGSLVDAKKGIIVTNYHVMDDARAKFGVLMEEKKSRVKIHGWLEIDFVGEASRFDVNRFKIVEAVLPKNAGRGFGRLDAVAMRVEPIDGAKMPKQALRFDATPAAFTQAQSTTICTVGFPGPPKREQGPKGEIDWNFVIRTLFGDLFGVKRLAPGRLLETFGAVEFDPLGIVFGHEATTFGGASGSAMIGWENEKMPGFGLHFSGLTGDSNYAIALAKVAKQMEAIGVPV